VYKFVLIFLFASISASAELSISVVFQDSMVLQREMSVPIWGKGAPNQAIEIEFNGQKVKGVVDPAGKWQVNLQPLKAGGPHKLTVTSGHEQLKFKDILVGEVWICSGQSNMQMGYGPVKDLKDAIVESASLPIRSLAVEQFVAFDKQDSFKGKWETKICNSAVGASFAYHLQKALNVPVGIILTCWGSSSIEGWMPLEMTERLPHFKKEMADFKQNDRAKVEGLLKDCRHANGKTNWARKDNIYLRTRPNILYNAMMHPLAPVACRGIVWYQGEANTKSLESMLQYKESLQAWVKELRQVWGRSDLQFLPVMLPAFGRVFKGGSSMNIDNPGARSWAWMRQSQLGLMELSNTGVANTIDLGDLKDIHPKDKKDIGRRLTYLALHNIHKKDVLPQGPTFKSVDLKGSSAIINFAYADGLKTKDGQTPKGFWLAGEDKVWYKATAEIKNNDITLNSPNVSKPIAVRYAFAAFPDVNLMNKDDLPAVPFRTDNWLP